jgi:glycerophosphoryl diester phosphodiesterase
VLIDCGKLPLTRPNTSGAAVARAFGRRLTNLGKVDEASIRLGLWERVVAGYSKVAKTAPPQRMLVSAHRGDRVRTPEQTMPAFVEAVRAGADAIELDVQWTKDQRMVLIHDWTVDRTTSSTGTVTDMTYAEIRACDAGSWFGLQFAGAQVPALEEVLTFAARYRRLLINVEIKSPQLTQAQAHACLNALVAAGVGHRTIVSSFDPPALATFRSVDPQGRIPSGLISHGSAHTLEQIQASGGTYYMPRWWKLTADRVNELKAAGIKVWVWPAVTEDDFESAYVLLPDAVVVDSVSDYRRWLATREASSASPIPDGEKRV